MEILDVDLKSLRPAEWRTTYMLKPDMRCLIDSLRMGWTAPLLIQRGSSTIIDGFSRWYVAQTAKPIIKRDAGIVPVTYVDVDDVEARVLHIIVNRANGSVVPKYLSNAVRDILISKKYTPEDLMKKLHMSPDEMSLLVDGSLFNRRKIAEYEYSKSWVPIESREGEKPVLERPPNADG